ncbi:MAG: hypothetical protein M3042_11840, partial [Actinomycetota bacterium]|nr:hypothetical protein [Actinomycetota bacterium]
PVGFAPPPPRPRRTGLIVAVVAGVVVVTIAVVTAGVLIAVNVGRVGKSPAGATAAGAPLTIDGPNGSTFHFRLPEGYTVSKDSDPRHGNLSASSPGDFAPYLDLYTDSRTGSAAGVIDKVATSVRTDHVDHGAKPIGAIQDRTVGALLVAQWSESFAKTKQDDAHVAMVTVVLIGKRAEYLEIDYSDWSEDFSGSDAQRTVEAVVRSLHPYSD